MKLSLDLVNQNVVKSDGTVWKSISTWVNGGSGNEEYYDISSCGDYWSNFSHFVKKSEFNPVTCYAKFKFTNITFKKSTIIQLREFSSVLPVNPYVDITATGKLVLNGNEYDTVDFTNSFIEVYITLYLGVCTTKVKIDNTTEYSDSFTYTKNFSDMVIQLGAKEGNVYSLPTSTYLYDFYLTDDIINTGDTSGKYLDKTGLSSVWSKIKSLFALKSEIPDTSNLQEKLVAGTNISITGNVISSTGSGSSGVDLSSYATKTEVSAKADKSEIPTKTSDLTNDSGFLTEHQDISNLANSSDVITGLSVNGKVITYTKGNGTTGTITTQDTNTTYTTMSSSEATTGTSTIPRLITPKLLNEKIDSKISDINLATVATSGSYSDLSDKPSIPSKTSDLTNDSGFITDISGKQDALTTAQLNAVNSGITASKVSTYDGYASSKADDGDVVHKSGNETISGDKTFSNTLFCVGNISKSSSSSGLIIRGGGTDDAGARLGLYGKDHSNKGNFYIYSNDGSASKILRGSANEDSLTWGGKSVDCIDSQGDGYIRYTNGIQVCWGNFLGITTSQKTISFPKSFSSTPSISVNGQSGIYVTIDGWTESTFTVVSTTSSNTGAWFLWLAIGKWK